MIHNYVLRINGRSVLHYINKKNASCSQLTFWQNACIYCGPFVLSTEDEYHHLSYEYPQEHCKRVDSGIAHS